MDIDDYPVSAIVFGLVATTALAGLATAASSPAAAACLLGASGVGAVPVGLGVGRLCSAGADRTPSATAHEAALPEADQPTTPVAPACSFAERLSLGAADGHRR